MAAEYPSISDDFLTCSICFEPFTDPRILPCVHTFCAQCLSKHISSVCRPTMRDPKFFCPTCRELVTIPDPQKPIGTWGQQFRKNFMINSLRDVVAEKNERRVSTSNMDAMTSVLSIASRGDGGHLCGQHPQKELELFCVDCDKLVCVTCIALSHRSCRQVITLKQVALEKRRQLSQIHNLIESYLSRSEAKKQTQMQELEKLKGQYEESMTRILEASSSLQRLVIEAEHTCIKELQTLYASHQQEQKRVINEAYISNKKLSGMCTAVADVLQAADDFRVVDAYPTLQCYQHAVGSIFSNEVQVHTLEFIRNVALYKTVEHATSSKIGEVKSVASKKEMLFLPISTSPTYSSLPPSSPDAASPTSPRTPVLPTSPEPGSLAALTSIPVLVRSLSTKVKSDKTKPSLRDIAIGPGKVIVVTDFSNSCLKSFYTHGNTEQHSKLVLDGQPHAIAVIAGNMMVTTVPKKKLLVLVYVTPNLLMHSSIYTEKPYWGVSAVTTDVLAVTTCPGSTPGTLVLVDLKGNVLKVINSGSGLFSNPLYLLTLLSKDIVVTDCTVPTIVCLRQNGSMIFKCRKDTSPDDGMGFKQPLGLACDKYGNIVIVDKWPTVGVVSQSGDVIQHILTKKEGLMVPKSVAVDEDNNIYIAEEGGKVLVFKPKC